MSLHPLVGHGAAREAMMSAHRRGELPASLLVHGARGIGKQRFALWLAQLSVCEATEGSPCSRCRACRMVLGLEHPDVHWYFPLARPKRASGDRLAEALEEARLDAIAERRSAPLRASYSDEVRGLYLDAVRNMRAKAHKRPTMAAGPVFVIGDAELLVPQESSPEAANALLKLLEEPPGAARFVLTSSEPGRLLPTIRSRTIPIGLGRLPEREIAAFLVEQADVAPDAASRAASLGQGSIGRALGFVPDDDGPGPLEELRRSALEVVTAAAAPAGAGAYGLALTFPPAGARKLLTLLEFVEEWLRDLGAVASGAQEWLLNRDAAQDLEALNARASSTAAEIAIAFAAVEQARERARANVNPQLLVYSLIRELGSSLSGTSSLTGART